MEDRQIELTLLQFCVPKISSTAKILALKEYCEQLFENELSKVSSVRLQPGLSFYIIKSLA